MHGAVLLAACLGAQKTHGRIPFLLRGRTRRAAWRVDRRWQARAYAARLAEAGTLHALRELPYTHGSGLGFGTIMRTVADLMDGRLEQAAAEAEAEAARAAAAAQGAAEQEAADEEAAAEASEAFAAAAAAAVVAARKPRNDHRPSLDARIGADPTIDSIAAARGGQSAVVA